MFLIIHFLIIQILPIPESLSIFFKTKMRDRRSSSSYVDSAPFRVVSVSNKGVGVCFLIKIRMIKNRMIKKIEWSKIQTPAGGIIFFSEKQGLGMILLNVTYIRHLPVE